MAWIRPRQPGLNNDDSAADYSLLAALMSAAIVGRAGGRDCVRSGPRQTRCPVKPSMLHIELADPRKVEMSICTFYANSSLHPIKMCGILTFIG